jgi:hypothetical protein
MDELRAIAQVVLQKTPRHLPLLDLHTEKGNKEEELLHFLMAHRQADDAEVLAAMYGQEENGEIRYKSLKYRLKQKLLHHLYFLQPSEDQQALHLELMGNIHKAALLLSEGIYKNAQKLLNKTARSAIEQEYTLLAIQALELQRQLAAHSSDLAAFQEAEAALQRLYQIRQAEIQAENLYWQGMMQSQRSFLARKQQLSRLPQIIAQLKEQWEQLGSYNIFEYYAQLQKRYWEYQGLYQELIDFNTYWLAQAAQLHPQRFDSAAWYCQQARYCLKAKKSQQARSIFDEKLANLSCTSVQLLHLDLLLQEKAYSEASLLLPSIAPALEPALAALYAAYLRLLVPGWTPLPPIALQDFRPEMLNKDESLALSLRIAWGIYDFVEALAGQAPEAMQAALHKLQGYCGKALRYHISPRGKLFFRLLKLAMRHWQSPQVLRNKGRYTFHQLQEGHFEGDTFEEPEPVPYEHLWEALVPFRSSLKTQKSQEQAENTK